MASLDPRIEEIRKQYGLQRDDFWELPQRKGTWIAKHSALEVVAVKAKIDFLMPQIVQADTEKGVAVLVVEGRLPDGRTEWATGEASSKNNKNAYPWAMAEKRAKDRVILKLAGIHGLVYSEDEGDFKVTKAQGRALFTELQNDIHGCNSLAELQQLWADGEFQAQLKSLPDDWMADLTAAKDSQKQLFEREAA